MIPINDDFTTHGSNQNLTQLQITVYQYFTLMIVYFLQLASLNLSENNNYTDGGIIIKQVRS